MTPQGQVGFSQRIRLDWLEYTAQLVLAGNSRKDIVAALQERHKDKLSVASQQRIRGNREKAITILTRIWVSVPPELEPLRNAGLDHLRRLPPPHRTLVHWCMCMAVYPFFGTVADAVGRLLRLQGTVAAAQVQRRLRDRYGERQTVARAAQRILRAYIDWGVLAETGDRGIYHATDKIAVDAPPLALWAMEATLVATGGPFLSATALFRAPLLFPFDVASPSPREIETHEPLEISRHGLDQELLVSLAKRDAVDMPL